MNYGMKYSNTFHTNNSDTVKTHAILKFTNLFIAFLQNACSFIALTSSGQNADVNCKRHITVHYINRYVISDPINEVCSQF